MFDRYLDGFLSESVAPPMSLALKLAYALGVDDRHDNPRHPVEQASDDDLVCRVRSPDQVFNWVRTHLATIEPLPHGLAHTAFVGWDVQAIGDLLEDIAQERKRAACGGDDRELARHLTGLTAGK